MRRHKPVAALRTAPQEALVLRSEVASLTAQVARLQQQAADLYTVEMGLVAYDLALMYDGRTYVIGADGEVWTEQQTLRALADYFTALARTESDAQRMRRLATLRRDADPRSDPRRRD